MSKDNGNFHRRSKKSFVSLREEPKTYFG